MIICVIYLVGCLKIMKTQQNISGIIDERKGDDNDKDADDDTDNYRHRRIRASAIQDSDSD